MEMYIQINNTTAQETARIDIPCRGYFTNWRVWINGFGNNFRLRLSKIADPLETTPGSSTFSPFDSKKGWLIEGSDTIGGTSDPTNTWVTGFLKRKIHVYDGDQLHIWADCATEFDIIIQATFVPYKGEVLKARHIMSPDMDGPVSFTDAYVIPINGVIVGYDIRFVLNETTQAADAGIYEFNLHHLEFDSYDTQFKASGINYQGDVVHGIDEYPKYDNVTYGKGTLAIHNMRSVFNEPQLYSFKGSLNKSVRTGDIILPEIELMNSGEGGTIPDYRTYDATYFIKVAGTESIMIKTEHIYFEHDSATMEVGLFQDYGSELFV